MAECGKKLNADQWQSGRVGRMTAAQGQLSLESVRLGIFAQSEDVT